MGAYSDITQRMENQMKKNMEHNMDTAMTWGFRVRCPMGVFRNTSVVSNRNYNRTLDDN